MDEATLGTTPVAEAPFGIATIHVPADSTVTQLEDQFLLLLDEIDGITRRDVTLASGSVTAVYLGNESSTNPRFGMVVGAIVKPSAAAGEFIEEFKTTRWGNPDLHDLTASGDGHAGEPAYREFSRTFPPGQFVIPNQPVYFLLWYRANDPVAFMVIGESVETREQLAMAVAETFAAAA